MFSKIMVSGLFFLVLAGCQGISIKEIRKRDPVHYAAGDKSVDMVFQCLNGQLNEFRGDGRLLSMTYPASSVSELSVGAMQAGTFKHYYLITLEGGSESSSVAVRRSPSDYVPMSQKDLIEEVNYCMD